VTEAIVEVIATLTDALPRGSVASGQVLHERVGADTTGAARGVVGTGRVRQV